MICVMISSLVAAPCLGKGPNSKVSAEISAGGSYLNVKDRPVKTGEYLPMQKSNQDKPNPFLRLNTDVSKDDKHFSMYGQYLSDSDNRFGAKLSTSRLDIEADYHRFFHFLDHDPLINYFKIQHPDEFVGNGDYAPPPFPGLKPNGQKSHLKVFKEDLSDREYFGVKRGLLNLHIAGKVSENPSITPYIDFRDEERNGHRQAVSYYMCSACHIQGRTREINQSTKDIRGGVNAATKTIALDASALYHDFDESASSPKYKVNTLYSPYDASTWNGYQLGVPFTAFTNVHGPKMLYGASELPYDDIPDHKKWGGEGEFNVALNESTNLYFHSIYTTTEDDYNNANLNFGGVGARLTSSPFLSTNHARPLKYMTVSLFGRYERVDNDDVLGAQKDEISYAYNHHILWDVGNAMGKSNLGKYYNMALNQLQNSALTRDTFRMGAKVSMPLTARHLLSLSYNFVYEDRDNFEVDHTSTHKVKALLRGRFHPGITYRLKGSFVHESDPFENLHAAGEDVGNCGDIPGVFPNKEVFSSELADRLRKRDLSSVPEDIYQGSFNLDWLLAKNLMLSAGVDYRYAENNSDSDMSDEYIMPMVTLSYTPSEKYSFTLTYAYNYAETDTDLWQSVTVLSGGQVKFSYGNYVKGLEDKIRNHVVSLGAVFRPTKRLSLDTSLSYTKAKEDFNSPGETVVSCKYNPAKSQEVDIRALNEYSKLDYDIFEAALGASYALTKTISLSGSISYQDVSDGYGYIYGDEDGRALTIMTWLTWKGF